MPLQRPDVFPTARNAAYEIPSLVGRSDIIDREVAGSHNNFYEFLSGRGGPVWQFCGDFTVEPWQVEITGECNNPMTLDLDDIFAFEHEERVYHFRCVERWAMKRPVVGISTEPIDRARGSEQSGAVREVHDRRRRR